MLLGNVLPQSYGNHKFLVRVRTRTRNFCPGHRVRLPYGFGRMSEVGRTIRVNTYSMVGYFILTRVDVELGQQL